MRDDFTFDDQAVVRAALQQMIDPYCNECGDLIDGAVKGCENPHCGETPDEKRLRESAE